MEAAKLEIEKSAAGTETPAVRRGVPRKVNDQRAMDAAIRWARGESATELAKEFSLSRHGLYLVIRRAIREMVTP